MIASAPLRGSTAHAADHPNGHPREAAHRVPCAETVDAGIFIEDFTTCRRVAREPPARLLRPDGGRPKYRGRSCKAGGVPSAGLGSSIGSDIELLSGVQAGARDGNVERIFPCAAPYDPAYGEVPGFGALARQSFTREQLLTVSRQPGDPSPVSRV
jgi:hypothetical protein